VLSVIVPARNNALLTRECIAVAIQSLDLLHLTCEFVLIDDASDRGEGILDLFKQFRANHPRHRFVIARTKTNVHYSGVFSLGLHLARLERIFFLSNDMLITPHFFTAVLGVAALDSKIGIVRGTSNHTDSHPEHTVPLPKAVSDYPDISAFSRAMFEIQGLTFVEDGMLSGDAVLIARSVVDRIGVMDLGFFGYFGDVDFGMRAHLAGFKLVCAKGAWLWHEGAGHVKREAKVNQVDINEAWRGRLSTVDAAYQVFRQKWDPDLPATYSIRQSLELFPIAVKNAARVKVKYDLPSATLDNVELV
jgi:GT2 family glycosyltransferase